MIGWVVLVDKVEFEVFVEVVMAGVGPAGNL